MCLCASLKGAILVAIGAAYSDAGDVDPGVRILIEHLAQQIPGFW
jgi:hypothetical protein